MATTSEKTKVSKKAAGSAITALIVAALAIYGISGAGDIPANDGSSPSPATAQLAGSEKASSYAFRSDNLRNAHYDKHGKAMGYADPKAYEAGANEVIGNPESLHKTQREDGDDVYYLQSTDELVIVSTDGYIRTYFNPGGIGYYNRQ